MRFFIDCEDFDKFFVSTENEERLDRYFEFTYNSTICNVIYFYYVKDELYNWFKELQIDYSIGYYIPDISSPMLDSGFVISEQDAETKWYIDIMDNNKAMLFKLTWG